MARKKVSQGNLNVETSAELLSYVINQTPVLRENLDLPVQGQSIKEYGAIIIKNPVYKNAFLNTLNIIGLTVITRNHWENPWKEFTDKGKLSYGDTVREIICDIANIYDYNEYLSREHDFIKTEVPNVLNYLHEVNYQKFYKTTTSDEQMAMAFEQEDLFMLVDLIVNSLFEGYEYDHYLMAKYILARRILNGTVTPIYLPELGDTNPDARTIVARIKEVSNNMSFRSPNYNPAGIRKATSFDNQFAIVSTKFDAVFTTSVLATSLFKSEAEMKAHMELCDGFGNFDEPRLKEIFAKRDDNGNIIINETTNEPEYQEGYVPITTDEKTLLNTIPCVLVGRDFFQFYAYGLDNASGDGLRRTEFFNPQTLKTNHWLHDWGVISTSPFENSALFIGVQPAVDGVTINPHTAEIMPGQSLQLNAVVETTGFANKSVYWAVDEESYSKGIRISDDGKLTVPADMPIEGDTYTIGVKATSIFDKNVHDEIGVAIYIVTEGGDQ